MGGAAPRVQYRRLVFGPQHSVGHRERVVGDGGGAHERLSVGAAREHAPAPVAGLGDPARRRAVIALADELVHGLDLLVYDGRDVHPDVWDDARGEEVVRVCLLARREREEGLLDAVVRRDAVELRHPVAHGLQRLHHDLAGDRVVVVGRAGVQGHVCYQDVRPDPADDVRYLIYLVQVEVDLVVGPAQGYELADAEHLCYALRLASLERPVVGERHAVHVRVAFARRLLHLIVEPLHVVPVPVRDDDAGYPVAALGVQGDCAGRLGRAVGRVGVDDQNVEVAHVTVISRPSRLQRKRHIYRRGALDLH